MKYYYKSGSDKWIECSEKAAALMKKQGFEIRQGDDAPVAVEIIPEPAFVPAAEKPLLGLNGEERELRPGHVNLRWPERDPKGKKYQTEKVPYKVGDNVITYMFGQFGPKAPPAQHVIQDIKPMGSYSGWMVKLDCYEHYMCSSYIDYPGDGL